MTGDRKILTVMQSGTSPHRVTPQGSMNETYHRPPLTYLDHNVSAGAPWISVARAFEKLGLRLHELEDRLTFEYFVSPIVRYAVRLKDGWHNARGPYQVLEYGALSGYHPTKEAFNRQAYDEGYERFETEQRRRNGGTFVPRYDMVPHILMHSKFPRLEPFSSDPSAYLISEEDCDRILKASPYLFDSLALNAWRVGTHEIYPLVTSPEMQTLPPFPGSAIKGDRKSILKYRRDAARYESERSLNLWAASIEDPSEVLTRFKSRFKSTGAAQDRIVLLSEPWVFRVADKSKPSVEISPLFIVVDERVLEPRFRGRWWFERNVGSLQAYEENAEASRNVSADLLMEQVGIEQERRRRSLAHRASDLEINESRSMPEQERHIQYFPNWLFTCIARRQRTVLRAALKHRRLHQSLYCSLCGVKTGKRMDKPQGRKPKYCDKCNKYALSLERRVLRDSDHRRRPWRFSNKPRP